MGHNYRVPFFIFTYGCKGRANGLRYLRVGGRGQCLGAGQTRSQKNACKPRRIPHVRCTLCWLALCKTCRLKKDTTANTPNFYTQLIFFQWLEMLFVKMLNNQKPFNQLAYT